LKQDKTIAASNQAGWGSDPVAELLRRLDFEFVALTPGSSFRGLHDSLVNHLGNEDPRMLLFIHEESAVAAAHGYYKASGKPMAVALHANLGLMHATMAIFNAWCDRVPMLILGAIGPMDAELRRPWVDWLHTATDVASLIRGYTKWDNQPASVPAAIEAVLRAHQIALTAPKGPTYVCLDVTLQELPLAGAVEPPALARFAAPPPADPAVETVDAIAAALASARRPVLLMGRVSPDRDDWKRRVELAERLNAQVLTDLKVGARFPTRHRCHPHAPGLSASPEALRMIAEADVIVSLDWIDLGGTLRLAFGGADPTAKIIHCSVDQYSHNGWSMDYLSLPPVDVAVLAEPDRVVARLLEKLPASTRAISAAAVRPSEAKKSASGDIGVEELALAVTDALRGENPCYIRLPLGWPDAACDFTDPLDYLGYDGAGGIGSGPGMAVGAAIALRQSDRLPVAVLGDGDFLMGVTALWTAVNQGVPLLVVVANNHSFFNDELHQERVARIRGRPVENRGVGLRMEDPVLDLAKLAEGQGAIGFGPIRTMHDLEKALGAALTKAKAGATCVIDVHVTAEYARGIPARILGAAKT
jgi:thiamine pyrophosphate-dependent acetolactate synthase large subunit-like protein